MASIIVIPHCGTNSTRSVSDLQSLCVSMGDEIVLLDFWANMFGMSVRISLAEKGIKYEYKEQDLANKGSLLQEMNPVHKKVPVLIHNGKPICETLNIMEYIDEVWKDDQYTPLMPSHPYQRAHARFWADFINKKPYDPGKKLWQTKGEEQEAGKKDLLNAIKLLEEELGDRLYFGGETFGFIDISLIGFYSWFCVYETFGKFSSEVEFPKLVAWAKRCMLKQSVSKVLPDGDKVYEFALWFRKWFNLE